jgi:hypothetical protein
MYVADEFEIKAAITRIFFFHEKRGGHVMPVT